MEPDSLSHDASTLLKQQDWLRGLVRALVRDEHHAEDVAQEAWLAAVERPPRRNLRGFLRGAARNITLRLRSREASRERHEREAARPEGLPTTADVVEREALRREVVNGVLALPDPNRTIVLLRHFEDAPPKAIARRFGISVEATRRRLRQAEEEIRRRLRARYGERWSATILPLLGVSPAVPAGVMASAATTVLKVLLVAAAATGVYLLLGHEPAEPEIRGEIETISAEPLVTGAAAEADPPAAAVRPEPVTGGATTSPAPPPADVVWPVARGTVAALDGSPIPGALVRAVYDGPDGAVAETRCDADGSYALHADVRGRTWGDQFYVEASAPGRFTDERRVNEGEVIHFRLGPAGRLAGRVTYSGTSSGVAHVTVHLTPTEASWWDRWKGSSTDPEGRFRFNALRPGRYRVFLGALNTELYDGTATWVRVKAGHSARVDFALERPRLNKVSGVVVAEPGDRPLANVPVSVCSNQGAVEVKTDTSGRFCAENVPREFEVHPHGMVTNGDGCFSLVGCERAAEKPGVYYRLRYQPAARLTGVLIDAQGQPIAGAEYARPDGTARTDASGGLELVVRPGRMPDRLEFRFPGSRPRTAWASPGSRAGAPGAGLVFQVPDSGTVSGVVRTADGRPIAAARVRFSNRNRQAVCRWFSGATRQDGRYLVRDLTLGRYFVRVEAAGFPEFGSDQVIDVLPGQHVTVDDLILPAGFELSGKVISAHGDRIAGIRVSLAGRSNAGRRVDCGTLTDGEGRFHFRGLPQGRYELYQLHARDRGQSPKIVDIPAGEREILLRLEPLPRLIGRVRFAEDRRPATTYRVRFGRSGSGMSPRGLNVIDPEGRLELRLPKPGDYDVEVTAKHAGATFEGRERVTVREGKAPPEFTVWLVRTQSLAGFVRDADGTPIQDAAVVLLRPESTTDTPPRATSSDRSGRFTLPDVPPGDYIVRCRHPGWVPAERPLALGAGAYPVVDITLSAEGGRVRVTVTDPDGRPVPDARVHLLRPDGTLLAPERALYEQAYFARKRTDPDLEYASWYRSYNFTGPDGVLVRRFLPAGRFRVRAEAAGFRPAVAWARIRTGVESAARLVLER